MNETGDAACWRGQLCPECDAMLEDPAEPCWRCGTRAQPPTTT